VNFTPALVRRALIKRPTDTSEFLTASSPMVSDVFIIVVWYFLPSSIHCIRTNDEKSLAIST
jgi:hypothetical protein